MFKLGVISDSHGGRSMAERVCMRLKDVDALCHLGDGGDEIEWIAQEIRRPLYAVCGNCDILSAFPRERTECFSGVKTLMSHGHLHGVKTSLFQLSLRAEELGAGLALYGHTHQPLAEWAGGVLMVNPGALMDGCYAVIEFRPNGPCPLLHTV